MLENESERQALFLPGEAQSIHELIHAVRGVQVMFDSDLAVLYQVETKRINEAVRRNAARFPERFCFQLSKEELEGLRSQFATSNLRGLHDDLRSQTVISNVARQRGGRRYLPFVFTEQGVAMLSAVLRSDVAVQVSIYIMDAFVEMRRLMTENATTTERIRALELRQLEHQRMADERFDRIFDYMEAHETPRQKMFFEGQVYDAFELLTSLVRRARSEIILVDGYVDDRTLNVLAKREEGVDITIWTRPDTRLTMRDVEAFNAQYPSLRVEHTTAFHDRFLIVDRHEGYLVGASLKDAGKKSFAIARIEDDALIRAVLARLK